MKIFKTLNSYEKFLFLLETYIILTLIIGIPFFLKSGFHLTDIKSNGCWIYQHGYHCPACGGTRSVDNLLHGHFIKALIYQPMVIYVVGVFVCTYIGFITYFISHGNIKIFEFKTNMVLTTLFVMMINFYINNFLIFYFKFDIFSLLE